MKVLVRVADHDKGPESYIEKSEADEIMSGSDYKDYDEFMIFEVDNIGEVIDKIDYERFVVETNTHHDEADWSLTVHDYYIE